MMNTTEAVAKSNKIIIKKKDVGEIPPLSKEQVQFLSRIDDLDRLGKWTFFVDMLSLSFKDVDIFDPNIEYNKKYFTTYYGVNSVTFNKWMEIFLPNLHKEFVKRSAHRFTEKEYYEIMNSLGSCDFDRNHVYSRLELAILVYGEPDRFNSKTAIYNFIKLDLEELLPGSASRLNKFPPAVVKKLLIQLMKKDMIGGAKLELKDNRQKLFREAMSRKLSNIENWTNKERTKERERIINTIDKFFKEMWSNT